MMIWCKDHPRYKAVYQPKVNCDGCELLYRLWKQIRLGRIGINGPSPIGRR